VWIFRVKVLGQCKAYRLESVKFALLVRRDFENSIALHRFLYASILFFLIFNFVHICMRRSTRPHLLKLLNSKAFDPGSRIKTNYAMSSPSRVPARCSQIKYLDRTVLVQIHGRHADRHTRITLASRSARFIACAGASSRRCEEAALPDSFVAVGVRAVNMFGVIGGDAFRYAFPQLFPSEPQAQSRLQGRAWRPED
jgi:hypothetical protein